MAEEDVLDSWGWEDEEDTSQETFRHFTRDELEKIEQRIFDKKLSDKKKKDRQKKNIEEHGDGARARKHYDHGSDDEDEEPEDPRKQEPDDKLSAGSDLPFRYQEMPPEFNGLPICDLDVYYEDRKTFMVISGGKSIYRFSGHNALGCLSAFHPIRRLAIYVLTHPMFTFVIITTILANSYVMTREESAFYSAVEIVFTAIYSFEFSVKILSRGFIFDKFTYLRDGWNWLDFAVIIMSYVELFVGDLGSFSALRTFRVFRTLKSVAVIPGLKTIVNAVIYSVERLGNVIVLSLFFLSLFALTGLQLYMGVLSQACIRDFDPKQFNMSWSWNHNNTWSPSDDRRWSQWMNNESHWIINPDTSTTIICGNATGAGTCPEGTHCIRGFAPNPNYGYTSYDNFFDAFLCAFRLMTQDYWENLYQITLRASGPVHIVFFIFNILLGSFYLVNLILAIVAMAYDELDRDAQEAFRAELAEREAIRETEEAMIEQAEILAVVDFAVQDVLFGSDEDLGRGNVNDGFVDDERRDTLAETQAREDMRVLQRVVDGVTSDEGDTDSDSDDEGPNFKEVFAKNAVDACNILCTWDCTRLWVQISEVLSFVVFDPFVELTITLCIIVNVMFMCFDSYNIKYDNDDELGQDGMSTFMIGLTKNGNYFFTAIFAIESAVKLAAMSPRYFFQDGWNIFDFFIVVLSLVELLAEGIEGLSMLRSFRLLRVFKLAKSWKSLNDTLKIMIKSMSALGNLIVVLVIIIFIFAVMGMQLFGGDYVENICFPKWNCVMPRWHFTDFLHSFMIVFRVLCGEWIESMWDCWYVSGPMCIPYFLAVVLIAYLVILNLFVALLLSNFSGVNDSPEKETEPDKTQIAFARIGRFFKYLNNKIMCRKPKREQETVVEDSPSRPPANNNTIANGEAHSEQKQVNGKNHMRDWEHGAERPTDTNNAAIIGNGMDMKLRRGSEDDNSDDEDLYAGHEHDKYMETEYEPEDLEVTVKDCCGKWFYKLFPCCAGEAKSTFMQSWSGHRLGASKLIENTYFEGVVLILILVSSFVMTLEDIYIETRPMLIDLLYYLDRMLTVVFLLETLLKLFAKGFICYFTDAWCLLDFVIVAVSIINFGASLLGVGNIPIFKTMRTLRALRPLRAMAKMQGMKVVVNALVGSLPAIANVAVVCLIFWLIFAIIGVNFFMGKFYKCIDVESEERFSHEVIPNRTVCLEMRNMTGNMTEWRKSAITFDNVGWAYIALLQIATFKGWMDIMYDSIDSVPVGQQPQREVQVYYYFYYVLFIIVGAFFTLNLLVGVIVDEFNKQKSGTESSLSPFITEDQKKYLQAMRKAATKKPLKALPRPHWKPRHIVFGIVTNKKFDMVIMGIILVNMVTMMCDHYGQTETWTFALDNINLFFIVVFTSEMLLKMFALGTYYFKDTWNLFDFFVVMSSILSLFLSDLIEKYFVSPTMLRVVRVMKIGRILRLIKSAKGIRTLIFSLIMALPALVNIALLLLLVMFIFSVFGMTMFKQVGIIPGFDDVHNFQTFVKTFVLLFQISTTAGWAEAWLAMSVENTEERPDRCQEPNPNIGSLGSCGSVFVANAFMVTYLVMAAITIVNMFVAVILENYTQATEDVSEGVTGEDYDLYFEVWQEFDPQGTQYMEYKNLSEFLDVLEPPLQIARPNHFKIIKLDIPIVSYKNSQTGQTMERMVNVTDILDIITKDFFARKNNTPFDEAAIDPAGKQVQEVGVAANKPGYEMTSTSMFEQQRSHFATVIQRAFRFHNGGLAVAE